MQICSYIPQGLSDEKKDEYMQGMKQLCVDVYNFKMAGSNNYLHEYRPEDVCEEGNGSIFVLFYTTVGKTAEQYDETGAYLDRICTEVYGKKVENCIIFKEHAKNNIARNGTLGSRA